MSITKIEVLSSQNSPEIMNLVKKVYQDNYRVEGFDSLESLKDLINSDSNIWFGLRDCETNLVSCFRLIKINNKVCETSSLIVDPDYKGYGTGKKIVEYVQNYIQDRDFDFEINSLRSSTLIRMFQDMGATIYGYNAGKYRVFKDIGEAHTLLTRCIKAESPSKPYIELLYDHIEKLHLTDSSLTSSFKIIGDKSGSFLNGINYIKNPKSNSVTITGTMVSNLQDFIYLLNHSFIKYNFIELTVGVEDFSLGRELVKLGYYPTIYKPDFLNMESNEYGIVYQKSLLLKLISKSLLTEDRDLVVIKNEIEERLGIFIPIDLLELIKRSTSNLILSVDSVP